MDASALTAKLERALLDLGDTPDTVAAVLEGQGVTGVPGETHACPVAVYLKQVTGLPHTYAYMYCGAGYKKYAPMATAPVPDAVIDFIDRFDGGDYPALEAKP